MVMPALVAGIHVFDTGTKTAGRNKSSHDEVVQSENGPAIGLCARRGQLERIVLPTALRAEIRFAMTA